MKLIDDDVCLNCFHQEHPDLACELNDDEWLDPMVGGSPLNIPRKCGCKESVNREQRGNIRIIVQGD